MRVVSGIRSTLISFHWTAQGGQGWRDTGVAVFLAGRRFFIPFKRKRWSA